MSPPEKRAHNFVQIEEGFAIGGAFKDHTIDSKMPHLIQFLLFVVNHRFGAGSQIRLVIASRDYPFFLPNLNQPRVRIYRDASHSSALLLPVAPGDAAGFTVEFRPIAKGQPRG